MQYIYIYKIVHTTYILCFYILNNYIIYKNIALVFESEKSASQHQTLTTNYVYFNIERRYLTFRLFNRNRTHSYRDFNQTLYRYGTMVINESNYSLYLHSILYIRHILKYNSSIYMELFSRFTKEVIFCFYSILLHSTMITIK